MTAITSHAFAGKPKSTARHPLDGYETPPYVTEALLKHVKFSGSILEPAAGTGKMVKVLRAHGYAVEASDITRGKDFLKRTKPASNIVTNPPYFGQMPFDFVNHSFRLVKQGKIALLFKHGFLWSKGRRAWLQENPPSIYIFMSERIIFNFPNGKPIKSQFFDHIWLVWDKTARQKSPEIYFE